MTLVSKSIGDRFENVAKILIPELESASNGHHDADYLPDFFHPTYPFWVEAKVGNILWGPRIKGYQSYAFDRFSEPVIYMVGMHNFDKAHKRLQHKTERGRQNYLEKHMGIPEIYFINAGVMKSLWKKEKRLNKKKTMEYFMLKKGIINHILLGRKFEREERTVTASSYYGLKLDELLITTEPVIQHGREYRAILHNDRDKVPIEYLRENGFIK